MFLINNHQSSNHYLNKKKYENWYFILFRNIVCVLSKCSS